MNSKPNLSRLFCSTQQTGSEIIWKLKESRRESQTLGKALWGEGELPYQIARYFVSHIKYMIKYISNILLLFLSMLSYNNNKRHRQ